MEPELAATALVETVRARPWGLAVAAIGDGRVIIRLDEGTDAIGETTLFQIGSITKTMTGLLLADAVVRRETSLTTPLSQVLGSEAGSCSEITLLDLATQRSGLPRLPPNLDLESVDPADPYAAYTEDDLIAALDSVDIATRGTYAYSNMGFMVLGLALSRLATTPFPDLIHHRVFTPLGLSGARCGTPLETDDVAPGYSGAAQVPWWRTNLPGPGGVGMSVADLAAYVRAHIEPHTTSIGDVIALAIEMHATAPSAMGLGWGHQGGGLFHDGGTGGFRSFIGFHPPTGTGVALLANSAQADVVASAGFAVLTHMVQQSVTTA
jgi:CubicO group peptidase (beta-lactamase class C family)